MTAFPMTVSVSITVEVFVQEARRLRAAADASEREFMMFLRDADASGFWKSQAPTFEKLLKQYDICCPVRYRNSCVALQLLPEATVATIGMKASVIAMNVPRDDRAAAIELMEKRATANGVPLSEQNARNIVATFLGPKPAQDSLEGRLRKQLHEAQAEVKQLKKVIREKDREIARLRKQLAEPVAAAAE
jgi:hypothetical protein